MKPFRYSVRLPFTARPATPEWLGGKFLATLEALTQIDPNIFPEWEVGDLSAMKGYPLAAARSRIAEIIGRNVSRYDLDLPKAEARHTAVAHTAVGERSQRMTFRVGQGSVWLRAGDEMVPLEPMIVTYSLFRAALLAINAIWLQPWACAQAFRSVNIKVPLANSPSGQGYELKSAPMIPADPTFPESIFHIPWFAYLSAPLAAGVKLPPEILSNHTADGGLLMTATEARLNPEIPEHARRARILAETLIARTATSKAGKQ